MKNRYEYMKTDITNRWEALREDDPEVGERPGATEVPPRENEEAGQSWEVAERTENEVGKNT